MLGIVADQSFPGSLAFIYAGGKSQTHPNLPSNHFRQRYQPDFKSPLCDHHLPFVAGSRICQPSAMLVLGPSRSRIAPSAQIAPELGKRCRHTNPHSSRSTNLYYYNPGGEWTSPRKLPHKEGLQRSALGSRIYPLDKINIIALSPLSSLLLSFILKFRLQDVLCFINNV
jgi:hypothetical protein